MKGEECRHDLYPKKTGCACRINENWRNGGVERVFFYDGPVSENS